MLFHFIYITINENVLKPYFDTMLVTWNIQVYLLALNVSYAHKTMFVSWKKWFTQPPLITNLYRFLTSAEHTIKAILWNVDNQIAEDKQTSTVILIILYRLLTNINSLVTNNFTSVFFQQKKETQIQKQGNKFTNIFIHTYFCYYYDGLDVSLHLLEQ